MIISKNDKQTVKSLADTPDVDISQIVSNRASTYLALETIEHLRKSTKNNIMLILLGALIGISPSIIGSITGEPNVNKELLELHKELRDIKAQLNHSQTYQSKRDSL